MKKLVLAFGVIVAAMALWRMTIETTSGKYRDKVVLRWVTDINPTRAEQVAEFERLHPNIHVVIDPSAKGKELIQISGGKGPDLIDLGTDTFVHYARNDVLYDITALREADNRKTVQRNQAVYRQNLQRLQASGAATPPQLEKALPDSIHTSEPIHEYNQAIVAWNRSHDPQLRPLEYLMTEDVFWPAQLPRMVYDGRILAAPANASSSIIIYNRDVFDKYSVSYPEKDWSTDEFFAKCEALTHLVPGENIYESFGMLPIWVPQCWLYLGGGRYFNKAEDESALGSERAKAALAFVGEFWQDNADGMHVAPTASDSIAGLSGQGGNWESYGRGNIAMINGGRWVFNLTGPLLNYGYVRMPRFPDIPEEEIGIYFGGRTTGITRDSKHPEEAFLFLKYLIGRNYGRVLLNSGDGVSGVRYYQDEDWALFDPQYPEVQSRMLMRIRERGERTLAAMRSLSTAELKELALSEWAELSADEQRKVAREVRNEMRMIYNETAKGVSDEISPYMSQATINLATRTLTERVQNGSVSASDWATELKSEFDRQLARALNGDETSLKYQLGNIFGFGFIFVVIAAFLMFMRKQRRRQDVVAAAPGGRKERFAAGCFLAPNFAGFLLFTLVPVIFSFVIAFTDFNTLTNQVQFAGFRNFVDQLSRKEFWYYLFNTVVFMLGLPISVALSLILALLLNNKLRGYIVYRTIFYLPSVVSGVAIFLLWKWMYNPEYGLINSALQTIGVADPPKWLSGDGEIFGIRFFWSKPALIAMGVWMGMGGPNVLLFLAGLAAISPELYEASEIDGANKWQRFWRITWPLLTPTTFFIMIMGVIHGLQGGFEMAYTMTQGGPEGSTTTLGYHIYNTAFFEFEMGQAAAVAWFLFLLVFGVTLLNWKFGESRVNY